MTIPIGADPALVKRSARRFDEWGFELVRLLSRSKKPYDNEWTKRKFTPDDLEDGCNFGVKMGDRHGSADGDMDCAEARAVAPVLLPPTGMIWGHDSAPYSHYIYRTTPAVLTAQYPDPLAKKSILVELRGLAKDGTVGLQTMAPGSMHPDNEVVRFEAGYDGMPANVAGDTLKLAMNKVAAAAALARHFPPAKGGRNAAFLHLAGAAVRAGWHLEQAVLLNRAIYRALWGNAADFSQAAAEVRATYEKHAANQPLTGRRSLVELIDARVVNKVFEWLGWSTWEPTLSNGAPRREHPHGREEPPHSEGWGEPPPGEAPTRVEILDMSQVMSEKLIRPREAVEGLITAPGNWLLVGAMKAGKTILAIQMALDYHVRHSFLGNFRMLESRAVLIIEQDDPAGLASVQDILLVYPGVRDPPKFRVVKNPAFTLGEAFFAWLEEEIHTHDIGLVVIDSYTKLRARRPHGTDIVKVESEDFTMCNEVAKRTNCLCLVLHHPSKTSASLDWDQQAAGTYGIGAAVDGMFRISRFRDLPINAGERLLQVRGRHTDGAEMVLKFVKETLSYKLLLTGAASSHYPDARMLERFFSARTFSPKDVMTETGMSRATITRIIDRLVFGNVLDREGYGSYRFRPGWRGEREGS
jgi:hypothetical protein